jgi:hypothetical protein
MKRLNFMPNYSFSLTNEKTSLTMRGVDERLLHDVQRYSKRGLTQTAVTRKLEAKGWATHAIERALEQVRVTPNRPYVEPKWALRIFRFGFAGVFLINALVAWLQPEDFLNLMYKSLAVNWLGRLEWLIPVIALNDLAIAIVILVIPKRYRPYVYAWVGLWFLAITVIKLTALNMFTA